MAATRPLALRPLLITGAAVAAALAAVLRVHAAGQTLLATVLLAVTALAAWAYTSRRALALRYLLPGIAAALVFVVFPMLYTIGIGFTNYSSTNLLDAPRVREILREEADVAEGSEHAFVLLGTEGGGVRLRLTAPDGRVLVSPPLPTPAADITSAAADPLALQVDAATGDALPLADVVQRLPQLRTLALRTPEGAVLRLTGLRTMAQLDPRYDEQADGSLVDRLTRKAYAPDAASGFYTATDGERLEPGWRVGVGFAHYAKIFSEGKFREPFASVLLWTVLFAGLTVLLATALGLVLAVLLSWEGLGGNAIYRVVLFLPYAVPGFISILVFKGLFNQNLGEINLVLSSLFGIRPAWFSDPLLAKVMLLTVNVWLGFPYLMVLCTGLIKAIPADLYEASAVVGAGPWTNFRHITMPLIVKPLTPLLIAAFAFNFNNFVLISLLTGGRPDHTDTTLPAGTTDILVSYTWRLAFQDSGQQFGLAAAISTVIFLLVAAVTLLQLRLTRSAGDAARAAA